MSSACPGEKGLLDRFLGSEKFMASFFEKSERLARVTLGNMLKHAETKNEYG
jgi:hypothetical protein